MINLIFIAILGLIFYLFNELEDNSVRGNNFALFPNSSEAWTAKWKYPIKHPVRKWYYFGYMPLNEERFPFSSTLLVFLTDTEHLFQFLKFRSLEAAFLVIGWKWFIAFIIGEIISRIIKEVFIKKID